MDILELRLYSLEEIKNSALIVHPSVISKYKLKIWDILYVFEEWSNFTQLENPIYDEVWNEFWDSEWYYMSRRIADPEIRKMIAFSSLWHSISKRYAKLHELSNDDNIRIESMREAIRLKFENNPKLRQKLLETWKLQIIEYTFWWDDYFWVYSESLLWRNVLWKLLMETGIIFYH